MKPINVPEALRAGADYIEKNGWMNLAHGFHQGEKCACAVTSLTATVSWSSDLRIDALTVLADAIDPTWKEDWSYPTQPGMFVGRWNDEQPNGAVVIAKMREVAASVESAT